jgi:hypothetical protein
MRTYLPIVILLSLFSTHAVAVELTSEASNGFKTYIADFESQRLKNAGSLNADASQQERDQLIHGVIVVKSGKNNGETPLKSAMIHDWLGTVFISNATLDQVVSVLQDYPHHSALFAPDIRDAKVRSHAGDDYNVYVRIVKSKMMITDVLNTEQAIHFTRIDPHHEFCRAYSTKVAEVANAGTAHEHELPIGADRGLLWRLYGYWFLEERGGGGVAE